MRLAAFFASFDQILQHYKRRLVACLPSRHPISLPPENTLEDKIRDALAGSATHIPMDDVAKAYVVAINIIDHFLGQEFSERYTKPSNRPDPYMMNGFDPDRNYRFLYQDRVIKLADYLFNLQDEPGFNILIEQFTSNRDMRSVFLEAKIASYYKRNNFEIHMWSRTGIKGEDFDFRAARKGSIINVEVTGFTNHDFDEVTVKNTLNRKRQQLPDTAPAVVYCIIPKTWTEKNENVGAAITEITRKFFRGTKRVNAVAYITQNMERVETSAIFFDSILPIFHPSPRHTADLEFLRRNLGKEWSDVITEVRVGAAKLDGLSYWKFISSTSAN